MKKIKTICILFYILSINLRKTASNDSSELQTSGDKVEHNKKVTESPSTSVKMRAGAEKYVNAIMTYINEYLPKGIAPLVKGLIGAVPKTYLKQIVGFLKTVTSFNLTEIIGKGKKAMKMLELMI